ncbi:MAG: helix-turn-helix transcriptional regulator [Vulcanimicrobiaceae bacterium]|jgi:transcriptional regulator with XRE-family HTH domain
MSDSEFLARIGARVRELRAVSGLTQRVVAERAGLSRASIANVEAGRQNLRLRQLAALATALGVQVDRLVTGECGGDG